MQRIMGLQYGVLLYSGALDADRTSPTMISRAERLRQLGRQRPELAEIVAKRLAGFKDQWRPVRLDCNQPEKIFKLRTTAPSRIASP